MAKPKRRRIKSVLIVLLNRVAASLEATGTVSQQDFAMEAAVKEAEKRVGDVIDEDGPYWAEKGQPVYSAADALGTALTDEATAEYPELLEQLELALDAL